MVLYRICSLGILCLSLFISVQCQPDCFKTATRNNIIQCTNEDLRGLDATVYSQITGLTKNEIKSITLRNCTISNLDFLNSDYLSGMTSITLQGLRGLQNSHLSQLTYYVGNSLQQLLISDNPSLSSVDALIPQNFGNIWQNIQTFRVQNNAIENIDPNLFRAINGATEYNLRGNFLRTIDFVRHNSVNSVRKILLSGNMLSTINGLDGFTGLEELDLGDNQLTNVDNFVVNVLGSNRLQSLNLRNNLIQSFDPAGLPVEPPGSLAIDLENNKLTTITALGQSRAKNVQSLNLGNNGGLNISNDSFADLSNLKVLDVSGCGITQITTHLQNLPSLSLLSLQDNLLNELTSETFLGTINLEEIKLYNNQLESLGFIVSSSNILGNLKKLDVSRNKLNNLENFVSAPALQELRMDGGADSNGFSQLSSCLSFTQLPDTLKIVCARNLKTETVDGCLYQSFLDLLKAQDVIYNNDNCCDQPSCDAASLSNYPEAKQCLPKEELCTSNTVPPPGTTTAIPPVEGSTKGVCETPVRAEFHDLYDSELIVIAVGYILALLLLVMLIIMCLRRYRSYDKWLEDHQQRDFERQASSLPLQTMRRSNETLDAVDGRMPTSKMGGNGTLQRQKAYGQKSFDNISMASGYSQYSAANGKSPFLGRTKFKDACSIEMDETPPINRYISPSQKVPRLNSGEESPTAMSVYSYASHQPERRPPSESNSPPSGRRRHRSGGAVQRMNSGDLLELVDKDIIPPRIQVVLQRKATERRSQGDSSAIVRNARPYGTTPYRTKAKSSGMVKKKVHSPHLTVTKGTRRSGSRTPTVVKRALPDIPLTSQGSISSSLKSASSIASNTSKLSHSSMIKNNTVFMDGDTGESEYHETDIIGFG